MATFDQKVIEIVYTKYPGGLTEKESRLMRLYEMHEKPYTRNDVTSLVYKEYKSVGGYRDKEEYTKWIFESNEKNEKEEKAHKKEFLG